jgi:apolipoprotein N-acyltransferase
MMIATLCALLSAIGVYFSLNLGEIWPLAWLAPVPVLWLAFGDTRGWPVFFVAWAAYALGSTNLLDAYADSLPVPVLIIALTLPSLLFAGTVMGARRVARNIGPLAGVLAFAVLWTAWDYAASLGPDGTAPSPSYSQVGAPYLIQGASVFGLWIVTFLIGIVSASAALGLRTRRVLPIVLAIGIFAANAGFGVWRMAEASSAPTTRVGLAVDDSQGAASFVAEAPAALAAVEAYAAAARALAAQRATLIVFPEKLAILQAPWRDAAIERLSLAARDTKATIVAGFDQRNGMRVNEALIFTPDGAPPATYLKRHFVGGLEDAFSPGAAGFALPDRTGVAICKDMDFQTTLREDALAGHPTLLAVPAWDFDRDRYGHARLAIMRGVENGFAVARAAKEGLLTLSDAYGRVSATKRSEKSGMVMLVGDLTRGPGTTICVQVGDVFAWVCVALALALLGVSFVPRKEGGLS